jgi:hypothetical protein
VRGGIQGNEANRRTTMPKKLLSDLYRLQQKGFWILASIHGLPIIHLQRLDDEKYRIYLMMDIDTGVTRRNWIEAFEWDDTKVTIEPTDRR